MKKIFPPLILFFLSPAIGELLSSSAPPVEFFSFLGLTVLPILYGGGAILVRELVIRWQKGWASLFILGAAYGIIEEGLMVKSFFDPNWVDLGILGTYGRSAGVNWVWSVELTIFHGIMSIAVPILLVEIIFPERRNQTWLNRGWLIVLCILFVLDVTAGHFFMTSYRPEAVSLFITVILVAGLILLARRWSCRLPVPSGKPVKSRFLFWLAGFLGTLGFFLIFSALPGRAFSPVAATGIGVVWVTGFSWLVWRMSRGGTGWGDLHRLACAAGILSVFILFAPIREFSEAGTDNPAGMTIVGAVSIVLLILLWWRVKRRGISQGISHF